MITITLPNSDGPPLRLLGSLIFSGEASLADGKRLLRLSVYRVLDRDIVDTAYSIAFESTWKHEVERYLSRTAHRRELGAELRDLDLTGWVRGYPEASRFDGKHQRLMEEVTDRWKSLVNAAVMHLSSGAAISGRDNDDVDP